MPQLDTSHPQPPLFLPNLYTIPTCSCVGKWRQIIFPCTNRRELAYQWRANGPLMVPWDQAGSDPVCFVLVETRQAASKCLMSIIKCTQSEKGTYVILTGSPRTLGGNRVIGLKTTEGNNRMLKREWEKSPAIQYGTLSMTRGKQDIHSWLFNIIINMCYAELVYCFTMTSIEYFKGWIPFITDTMVPVEWKCFDNFNSHNTETVVFQQSVVYSPT